MRVLDFIIEFVVEFVTVSVLTIAISAGIYALFRLFRTWGRRLP